MEKPAPDDLNKFLEGVPMGSNPRARNSPSPSSTAATVKATVKLDFD
jgi:hypothetical protein